MSKEIFIYTTPEQAYESSQRNPALWFMKVCGISGELCQVKESPENPGQYLGMRCNGTLYKLSDQDVLVWSGNSSEVALKYREQHERST